jgi:hypothetical protein
MTALLYYSISSDLTKDEIIEIDKRVSKNQEGLCLFVRKLPSNSNGKAKNSYMEWLYSSLVNH